MKERLKKREREQLKHIEGRERERKRERERERKEGSAEIIMKNKEYK